MTSQKITPPENADKLNNSPSKNKGDGKRAELLDEAARVLNRRGVSQTSLRLIAKNVGVSRAALYYYVDDQQDLVYQCYVRACAQLTGVLEESINQSNNALDIIDDFVSKALDEDRPEFASLSDIAFLREEQRSIVLGLYKGVRSTLADIIAEGVSNGQLRSCNPRIAASAILGLIAWVPVAMRWQSGKIDNFPTFCQTIRETLKYGIADQRIETQTFNKFDLSSFFTSAGNVFDAVARVAARRETLVVAASWLFNQKGIDATSLEEIASTVGVTKKVIYHNIGGKDELVTECYRRAFRFFKFVADCAEECDGSRLEALCTALNTLAASSVRKDIAPLVPITGHDAWSEEDSEELHESVGILLKKGSTIYKQGITEGSIRPLNEQALLLLRPGFYEWMPRWGNSLTESELGQSPMELTNIYRLGLAPLDS
jgi:AcrR family transcriptional regulator